MQSIEGHLYIYLISIINKTQNNNLKTDSYNINLQVDVERVMVIFSIKKLLSIDYFVSMNST